MSFFESLHRYSSTIWIKKCWFYSNTQKNIQNRSNNNDSVSKTCVHCHDCKKEHFRCVIILWIWMWTKMNYTHRIHRLKCILSPNQKIDSLEMILWMNLIKMEMRISVKRWEKYIMKMWFYKGIWRIIISGGQTMMVLLVLACVLVFYLWNWSWKTIFFSRVRLVRCQPIICNHELGIL